MGAQAEQGPKEIWDPGPSETMPALGVSTSFLEAQLSL